MIFLSSNLYPFWILTKIILCNSDETGFLSDCPLLMRWIAIRCIMHFCNIGAWGMWACSLFLSLLSEHFPWNGLTDFHESVVMMNILCRWAQSQTIVHSFASFELRHLPRLISSLYLERPCVHLITVFANNFLPLVKHPNDINFFLILTSSFTFVCTAKSRDSNYCQV